MKLRVNTTDIDPIRVGDRLEFQFHSGEDLQYITLDNGDILGDIELSEIQLEQSSISTPFVEPMQSETVASGVFKTVQGISYEITSPESDTWAEIRQTVEGSITTYHNGPLQSTIAHTIDDIIFGIRDIVSGDQTSFNLRLDGIQQAVKDEMFESVQTQLSDFVGLQLTDIEGNINEIQNTVDGTIQSISDLEGNYNTIQNTVDSLSQIIGSDGGNIAQLLMNDQLFQVNVIDEIDNAKSSVSVLSDSIGLRSSGNQIFIGGSGIMIDAESIYLGSSTQIKDGLITNSLIAPSADIDGAKIANATISSAKIANLDVSKISGNKANFVTAGFNGISSNLTIDSRGLTINSATSWDMELVRHGIKLTNKHGAATGMFTALIDPATQEPKSLGVVAENGHDTVLGYRGNHSSTGTSWSTAVRVDGTTGDTSLQNNLRISGESIRMARQTIYPNWAANDSFYINNLTSGGITLRNSNSNYAGFNLTNTGEVVITGSADRLVVSEIKPFVNSHTRIKMGSGTVGGNQGVWLRDHTESSGIFMARNGNLYVMVSGKTYNMRTVLQNSGF